MKPSFDNEVSYIDNRYNIIAMYITDSSLIVGTCEGVEYCEAVTHTADLIQLAAPPGPAQTTCWEWRPLGA
jgi:hypothetical protein